MAEGALDPGRSVAVSASAGTGKTWLLTARITRLLLAGATPGGILALTFTRKAAAEMQARVNARLRALALADDAEATKLLREIGLAPDAALLARARGLYEEVLFAPVPLRTTTLHAFCQDLVARFALQTGTAPGFEVTENENALIDAAWQTVQRECLRTGTATEAALGELIAGGSSEHQLRALVADFLFRRNDWRALARGQDQPLADLRVQLEARLGISLAEDACADIGNPAFTAWLRPFLSHLQTAGGGIGRIKLLALAPALEEAGAARLARLRAGLYTQKGEPLAFKPSKDAQQKLGSGATAHLLQLHAELIHKLNTAQDRLLRQRTLQRTLAGTTLGLGALRAFEQEIRQRNQLPFADLEWRACQLLSDPEAGAWVQYRLDARIDHLLVDEFQDTSDTQWRLLLPLLQEMTAGGERVRSAFIVGDGKQSIYGFRRANAQLLAEAASWIEKGLDGSREQLSLSRRSAPAIIDFVNRLFTQPESALPDFPAHDTHRKELWGRVELAPLVGTDEGQAEEVAAPFRNPLITPRPDPENTRAYREGALIAERIRALMQSQWEFDGKPLAYDDITILLRKRTHQQMLERALADHGIPFIGSARGTLLQTVELRDLLALLRFLASPVRDLDLAHALRSPLFGCSDEALMRLAPAARSNGWWNALKADAELASMSRQLADCMDAARRLPAHDLLDRILCESGAAARYEAALPAAQAARVRANLGAFAQLTLETDAGRYPALPRVLRQLQSLEVDEAPPPATAGAVRILTIHAAKGLEASVVFLAQAACDSRVRGAGWLVHWPAGAERPEDFLLAGRKQDHDAVSAQLLQQQEAREDLEELNLLYVACTRARQLLHISGFSTRGADRSVFAAAQKAMQAMPAQDEDGRLLYRNGTPGTAAATAPAASALEAGAHLSQPLNLSRAASRAPSTQAAPVDAAAARRGSAVHLLLQKLSEGADEPLLRRLLAARHAATPREFSEWLSEARAVIAAPALLRYFDPARFRQAWNEVPLHYEGISGVIDRLVDDGETLWLLDYKSERSGSDAALLEQYGAQLRTYREGLRRLWPQRALRAGLVLTAQARWLELPAQ